MAKIFSKKHSIFYQIIFYAMLLGVTLIGFYKGVLSKNGSKDAQWYPSKLFSENIDFYNYYMENFSDWFMRSVPNYYYQLYYILYPLSSFSWSSFKIIWFLCNLIMLLFFFFLVIKDFKFSFKKMAIIFLPFFLGFPLVSVFSNGQSTLLVIIFTYISWKYKENKILLPILLSLITFKYSFGLPLLLGFFLMGYYKSVFIGGIITLIFPLFYSLQFKLEFFSTIFLPFKISTSATANALGGGPSNLMSLYGLFFDGPILGLNFLTITLLLFVLIFTFLTIKYRVAKETILVCSLLLSLFGFYHNGHDYSVFLIILPFVFRVKYFNVLYAYLLLFCLTPRIIRIVGMVTNDGIGVKEFMYNKYFVLFNVCVLVTFFFALLLNDINSKKNTEIIEEPTFIRES